MVFKKNIHGVSCQARNKEMIITTLPWHKKYNSGRSSMGLECPCLIEHVSLTVSALIQHISISSNLQFAACLYHIWSTTSGNKKASVGRMNEQWGRGVSGWGYTESWERGEYGHGRAGNGGVICKAPFHLELWIQ